MSNTPPPSHQSIISIKYHDLLPNNSSPHILSQISHAFGSSSPSSLGVIAITDIPSYSALRRQILPLSRQLSRLSPSSLEKVTVPSAGYVVGWSHGKERTQNGKFDTAKGSFYANPLIDDYWSSSPKKDDSYRRELERKNPHFYAPNVWPDDDLPELKPCFKELGQLVCNVGRLLARHCDNYVVSQLPSYHPTKLHDVLSQSLYCKGRLLHYFPTSSDNVSDWCGWHNDHGSLTGLVPAMYFNSDGLRIPNPDPSAGLYVQTRSGSIVKVTLPPHTSPDDTLLFQVGETMQIHTGGVLRATPHCVRGVRDEGGVTRESFAVFMEPEYEGGMDVPEGVGWERVVEGEDVLPEGMRPLSERWKEGMNFGEFSEETFKVFY